MRDFFLGRAELPQRCRRNEPDQQPKDREHHQQLEQGKPSLSFTSVAGSINGAEKQVFECTHADEPIIVSAGSFKAGFGHIFGGGGEMPVCGSSTRTVSGGASAKRR